MNLIPFGLKTFRLENNLPELRSCKFCGATSARCIYRQRLGICADCLSDRIWNDEKRTFADFIFVKGAANGNAI
jgi:hypothetical protein